MSDAEMVPLEMLCQTLAHILRLWPGNPPLFVAPVLDRSPSQMEAGALFVPGAELQVLSYCELEASVVHAGPSAVTLTPKEPHTCTETAKRPPRVVRSPGVVSRPFVLALDRHRGQRDRVLLCAMPLLTYRPPRPLSPSVPPGRRLLAGSKRKGRKRKEEKKRVAKTIAMACSTSLPGRRPSIYVSEARARPLRSGGLPSPQG